MIWDPHICARTNSYISLDLFLLTGFGIERFRASLRLSAVETANLGEDYEIMKGRRRMKRLSSVRGIRIYG